MSSTSWNRDSFAVSGSTRDWARWSVTVICLVELKSACTWLRSFVGNSLPVYFVLGSNRASSFALWQRCLALRLGSIANVMWNWDTPALRNFDKAVVASDLVYMWWLAIPTIWKTNCLSRCLEGWEQLGCTRFCINIKYVGTVVLRITFNFKTKIWKSARRE